MRPKKHETTGASDLFRARLDQIINMKHELVHLAGKIDWNWLDSEIAPLYSDKGADSDEVARAFRDDAARGRLPCWQMICATRF